MATLHSQNTKDNLTADTKKKNIPPGLWTKCPDCEKLHFNKALRESFYICSNCEYHFTYPIFDRIASLVEEKTFHELDTDLKSLNPLAFKGAKTYNQKLEDAQEKTGLSEACITGYGKLDKHEICLAVTDSRFIMGSMGSVVGEKLTRLIEFGEKKKYPVIIVSGSGGGARMYEGILSLMQMAKTSAALARLSKAGVPFISILTNPTMGGVMASFSSLGDVIIAEPKALLGFAGPRVIEQTIRQKLPSNFQSSEFLKEHGMIDLVVSRPELKKIVSQLLFYLN